MDTISTPGWECCPSARDVRAEIWSKRGGPGYFKAVRIIEVGIEPDGIGKMVYSI